MLDSLASLFGYDWGPSCRSSSWVKDKQEKAWGHKTKQQWQIKRPQCRRYIWNIKSALGHPSGLKPLNIRKVMLWRLAYRGLSHDRRRCSEFYEVGQSDCLTWAKIYCTVCCGLLWSIVVYRVIDHDVPNVKAWPVFSPQGLRLEDQSQQQSPDWLAACTARWRVEQCPGILQYSLGSV